MGPTIYSCGFKTILPYDFFCKSTLRKGRRLNLAHHLGDITENTTNTITNITGKCLPQMKIHKPAYVVKIELNENRAIQAAFCSCKAGIDGQCKHVAAVCDYVNNYTETSVTSQPRKWGIPKGGQKYAGGMRMSAMFPMTRFSPVIEPVSPSAVAVAFSGINCPFVEIMTAESVALIERTCDEVLQDVVNRVVTNEKLTVLTTILSSRPNVAISAYISQPNGLKLTLKVLEYYSQASPTQKTFFNSRVRVDMAQILSLAQLTDGQAKSTLWHNERKIRISSTKCHSIWIRSANFESLVQTLWQSSFIGNAATAYGNAKESAAIMDFSKKMGIQVVQTGLVICPEKNWLGAGPDGIYHIGNKFQLLEVKCPFSRKGMAITEITSTGIKCFVSYLCYINGKISLKESHPCYTQVQVAMYVLGINECSFVTYSSVETVVTPVSRSNAFLSDLIPKLEWFYFTLMLPKLYE